MHNKAYKLMLIDNKDSRLLCKEHRTFQKFFKKIISFFCIVKSSSCEPNSLKKVKFSRTNVTCSRYSFKMRRKIKKFLETGNFWKPFKVAQITAERTLI